MFDFLFKKLPRSPKLSVPHHQVDMFELIGGRVSGATKKNGVPESISIEKEGHRYMITGEIEVTEFYV